MAWRLLCIGLRKLSNFLYSELYESKSFILNFQSISDWLEWGMKSDIGLCFVVIFATGSQLCSLTVCHDL